MGIIIECACVDCVKRRKKDWISNAQLRLESAGMPEGRTKLLVREAEVKEWDRAFPTMKETYLLLDANGLVELIKAAKEELRYMIGEEKDG